MGESQTRSDKIEVRMKPDEKKKVKRKANALGLDMSPYIRMKILQEREA